jgi:hypothetical protein
MPARYVEVWKPPPIRMVLFSSAAITSVPITILSLPVVRRNPALSPTADIFVAGGVVIERIITDTHVASAGRVVQQRLRTDGGVEVTSSVAEKSECTVGRVGPTTCIA